MMYFVFKKTGKNTMDMFMISLAVSGIFFKILLSFASCVN